MEIENKKPNAQTNESLPKAYATTHTLTHEYRNHLLCQIIIVNDPMSYAFRIKQLQGIAPSGIAKFANFCLLRIT